MVQNWRRDGRKPALVYGTTWHKILETHYKTGGDRLLVELAAEASWQDHGNADDHRTLARAMAAYDAYLLRYGSFGEEAKNWGATVGWPENPIVEKATELSWQGALHPYTGKIDRIYTHQGLYFVEDHKTSSQLGQYYFSQFDPSNQMMGYCPTAAERVLTADLRWISASAVVPGVELLAFDEHGPNRKLKHSIVTAVQPRKSRVVELTLSDGTTLRTSPEHPWIAARGSERHKKAFEWQTAENLLAEYKRGHWFLPRFFTPWATDMSWESGWLAGIADGEGYVSAGGVRGRSVSLGVAQNPGLVHDLFMKTTATRGFDFESSIQRNVKRTAALMYPRGGIAEVLSFLGKVRPQRLLGKFTTLLRNEDVGSTLQTIKWLRVADARLLPEEEWVFAIETTSSTYFCEGFAAHNCWLAQLLSGLPIAGVRINAHGILKKENKFERRVMMYSPERLEEWGRNLNSWVGRLEESMRRYAENADDTEAWQDNLLEAFPHNFNACAAKYGQCTYTDVCTTPARLRDKVLASEYEQNPWNPLAAEDEDGSE